MPTLYVTEPGARIEKEYHRLLVTKDDEVLLRVPLAQVSQVVLVGPVGLTTPAMLALLGGGVPVLLVRRTGELIGRLLPGMARNLPLRQAQYRRNDEPAFALGVARAIVLAKLHNQRVVALRVLRRRPEAERGPLETLQAAEKQAQTADDLASLLGVEGAGARAYFDLYAQAFADEWGYDRRTRRPPKDPINALMSLGYTLLGNALILLGSALWAVGVMLAKPLSEAHSPYRVLMLSLPGAMVVIVPYGLDATVRTDWAMLQPITLAMVAYVAVFAGGVAFSLFYLGVRQVGPTGAMLYQYAVPPAAALLAWAILGDAVVPSQVAGMILTYAGLTWALRSRAAHRPTGEP